MAAGRLSLSTFQFWLYRDRRPRRRRPGSREVAGHRGDSMVGSPF